MTVECTVRGPDSKDAYVLGRSARELDRLDLQGIIYRDTTRRALMRCGISGDVTRLAGELVGPSGSVLGIDTDEDSVRSARRRAAQLASTIVAFDVGEAKSEINGFSAHDIALLEAQLRDEGMSSGGVLVCWPVVSAWCRKET
jgi:hypothetical protein